LKTFRANSVFRASLLNDKKYFNPVKIFRANSCFQDKSNSIFLNDKKYFKTVKFSGQAQVAQKS